MSNYTNFLLSAPKYATATLMSSAYNNKISHDKVSRFLMSEYFDSRTIWKAAKPIIRQQVDRSDDSGCLIVDDSIVEKPHSKETSMICYHFDHCSGSHVKGVNFVSVLYNHDKVNVPIQVRIVEKTQEYVDAKTSETKRRSPITKNEHFLNMLDVTRQQVDYKHVLADSWFGSADNIKHIVNKLGKQAIIALKSNRTVALSDKERLNGAFQRVDQLSQLQVGTPMKVYLRGVDFPVQLVKQVFTNKDGSIGILYLIATDLTLDYEQITTLYKRRWKVEEYHKSLKQHTSIGKSPTSVVETQANHFYAAIVAYIKLEKIRLKINQGHFKIRSAITLVAVKASMEIVEKWLA